MTMLTITALCL